MSVALPSPATPSAPTALPLPFPSSNDQVWNPQSAKSTQLYPISALAINPLHYASPSIRAVPLFQVPSDHPLLLPKLFGSTHLHSDVPLLVIPSREALGLPLDLFPIPPQSDPFRKPPTNMASLHLGFARPLVHFFPETLPIAAVNPARLLASVNPRLALPDCAAIAPSDVGQRTSAAITPVVTHQLILGAPQALSPATLSSQSSPPSWTLMARGLQTAQLKHLPSPSLPMSFQAMGTTPQTLHHLTMAIHHLLSLYHLPILPSPHPILHCLCLLPPAPLLFVEMPQRHHQLAILDSRLLTFLPPFYLTPIPT